ncbi:uncharacterized protein LOC116176222 [Photinus pyralis]|uniref:uncharacterized protein LOC116176222 n=1 Tax=Photinus pyralis TaxID=7054 RepID=UPI0012671823|nr:uncharacterized protein LOC116176222 [Photinus pyralis]
MFTSRGRVQALEQCRYTSVFGDVVILNQSLPMKSQQELIPLPSLSRTPFKGLSKSREQSEIESKRRASQLVDELLLQIYHRNKCLSCSGYTSTTSLRSQTSFSKYSSSDLEEKSVVELSALIQQLENHVIRSGCALVRKLKRRDALRRQREAHCDVISNHLHKHNGFNSHALFTNSVLGNNIIS